MSILDNPEKVFKTVIFIFIILTFLYTCEGVLLLKNNELVTADTHQTEIETALDCGNLSFFDAVGCHVYNFLNGVVETVTGFFKFILFIQPDILPAPMIAFLSIVSSILVIILGIYVSSAIYLIIKLVRGGG